MDAAAAAIHAATEAEVLRRKVFALQAAAANSESIRLEDLQLADDLVFLSRAAAQQAVKGAYALAQVHHSQTAEPVPGQGRSEQLAAHALDRQASSNSYEQLVTLYRQELIALLQDPAQLNAADSCWSALAHTTGKHAQCAWVQQQFSPAARLRRLLEMVGHRKCCFGLPGVAFREIAGAVMANLPWLWSTWGEGRQEARQLLVDLQQDAHSSSTGEHKAASWKHCQAKAAVLRQLLLHYQVQASLAAPDCYVQLCQEAKKWSARDKSAGRKALKNFLRSAAKPNARDGRANSARHTSAMVAGGATCHLQTINYYSTLVKEAPFRKRHAHLGHVFHLSQPSLLVEQLSTQQLDGFEGLVNAQVETHQIQEQLTDSKDDLTLTSSGSSTTSSLQISAGLSRSVAQQVDARSVSCSASTMCPASGGSCSTTSNHVFRRKAMSKSATAVSGRASQATLRLRRPSKLGGNAAPAKSFGSFEEGRPSSPASVPAVEAAATNGYSDIAAALTASRLHLSRMASSASAAAGSSRQVDFSAAVDASAQHYNQWDEAAVHDKLSTLPLDLATHSEHERQLAQVTTQDESTPWAWGGEVVDGDPDTLDAGFA
eukprot:gene6304-6539_t